MVDVNWRLLAACRDSVPSNFFPHNARHDKARTRTALRLCSSCPVRAACLEWAVEKKEYYGIWGGLTEMQRRLIIDEANNV